jgi:hypothetical protein
LLQTLFLAAQISELLFDRFDLAGELTEPTPERHRLSHSRLTH